MVGSPYSSLKVIHHRDKLEQLKKGEHLVPTQVQLFISDTCNQACSWCSYRMVGYDTSELFVLYEPNGKVIRNPKRMIPYDKVCEILEDCRDMGVKATQYTGGGEPTAHPDVKKIFQHTLKNGLDLALVTNGMLMPKVYDELVRAKWVRISIDAGNAGSYAVTRGSTSEVYGRVWANVEELVRLKEKTDANDLIIGIGFVVSRDNWREVVECTKRAKEAGVDNIRLSGLFQSDDAEYFKSFYRQAADLCVRAKALETKHFKVFNMFGDRVEDLAQHHPDYEFCGYQQFNTLIGGDLNVYRCCVTAYNLRGLIGSLAKQSFRELWESAEKQSKFVDFDATKCPRCMFNNKNRTILYALSDDPAHVNFI